MIVENATPSFRSSFLSLQHFPSIPYVVPFVSTLPFHSVLPSFPFNPYFPFVAASLRLKLFISLCPSSRFNSMSATSSLSFQLFPSVRSFLPLQLFPSVRSLLSFNSFLSFVIFFWFHLSPFICYFLPFRSTLSFHLFWPFIRYNLPFASPLTFLPLLPFMRYRLSFVSSLAFYALLSSFCFTSGPLFITSFLSFQAATCGHSSGCKWLQMAASGRKTTCSSSS